MRALGLIGLLCMLGCDETLPALGDVGPVCTAADEEQCNGRDDDCDGVVDEAAFGPVCPVEGGRGRCCAGRCIVEACPPGTTDADHSWSTGCETRCEACPPLTADCAH